MSDPYNGWREYYTPENVPYYYNSLTGATSWEKPAELRTAADAQLDGDWVWVPDDQDAYVLGKILYASADGSVTCQLENGTTVTWKKSKKDPRDVLVANRTSMLRLMDDLVQMDNIDEGTIIHTLRERFMKDQIYTSIGTILIAVNPFKSLGLYTPSMIDKYYRKGISTLPPHIFTIADAAYSKMMEGLRNQTDQAVLISGESGAGKTEATKQVLSYLAEVAGSLSGVENQILAANPILEAFGNAKTLRNNNSSRFGKWIEIQFTAGEGHIAGAKIDNYLLEKSRVVFQIPGERNYHIFYQLTKACPPALRDQLMLGGPEGYRYAMSGGTCTVDGLDDVSDFADVEKALAELNFSDEDRHSLFSMVAGCAHLGNVEFGRNERDQAVVSDVTELKRAARLFEVSVDGLQAALLTRTMRVRGQNDMTIPLSVEAACDNRDALSKMLYSNMFDWLVERINASLKAPTGGPFTIIGVLDIFGFEIFEKNSFEQLCINYANEKLQQHFNEHTFKLEEALYQSEGIRYDHVEFIDNQPCLDLVEAKPNGIISMLDEEVVMPKGTDESFLQKLHQRHDRVSERYIKPLRPPTAFVISHYAGEVMYDVVGFLEKNRDTLQEDLLNLVSGSQSAFVRMLFNTAAGDASAAKSRKTSLGSQFKGQLGDLMNTLARTTPHYVRCIKSNMQKRPGIFEGMNCLLQLRYSGVFEAVQIRKKGFPFRYSHEEFVKRYGFLGTVDSRQPPPEQCRSLLAQLSGDLSEIQIGRTRTLYRQGPHRTIELLRAVALEKICIKCQKVMRKFLARCLYAKLRAVQPLLLVAIANRNLAQLDDALDNACAGLSFELKAMKDARALREIIREEQRITAALTALQASDPEVEYDAISKLLDQAKAIEFNPPLVRAMRDKVKIVHERRETIKALEAGTAESDLSVLEPAIARAQACGLAKAHPACQAALKAIERIKAEKKIIASLEAGFAAGAMVARDLSSIDASTLLDAVAEAERFGMRTAGGIKLLSHAKLMASVRQTMAAQDWAGLDKAIKAALQAGVSGPELSDAKAELSHQAAVDTVLKTLAEGIQDFDGPTLEVELEKARMLNMQSGEWSDVVQLATELHAKISQVRALLDAGTSAVDEAPLRAAVELADAYGCNDASIQAARTLADHVTHYKAYARDAVARCQMHLLQQVMQGAQRINLNSAEIQRVSALLALDVPSFLRKEYEAASSMNDTGRLTTVSVRLKDELFKVQSLGKFAMESCVLYKTRDDYSKKKKKKADGMFIWSREPNSPALLRKIDADPQVAKIAKKMAKNLCGFMGDKKMSDPLFLAQEWLDAGVESELLRDELYAMLVKQLRENRNPDSEAKGWQLMAMTLQTFAPSVDFVDYVEAALRSYAKHIPICDVPDYVRHLHDTMRIGPRRTEASVLASKKRVADPIAPESPFFNAPVKLTIPATRPRAPVPDVTIARSRPMPKATAKVAGAGARAAAANAAALAAAAAAKGTPPPPPAAGPPATSEPILTYSCTALYAYTARDTNELTMAPGDEIFDVDASRSDWYIGTLGSHRGAFPANYVGPVQQVAVVLERSTGPASPVAATPAAPGPTPEEPSAAAAVAQLQCRALFGVDDDDEGYLKFPQGAIIDLDSAEQVAEGWLSGTYEGVSGLLPANFVELL